MKNETIRKMLWNGYNKVAFTHDYILTFPYNGTIYAIIMTSNKLDNYVKLDKASRGAGFSIRFKPSKSEKVYLLSQGAFALCSEKFFNETVATTKYNKGEISEKFITEYFGQVWEKDNVPFTMDGDITVNGKAYQIKHDKATFTNEKSLKNLTASLAKADA